MPIYDTYDGIYGPPPTAATDSEYKYVNVRRYDLAEEVAPDALVADGADAPAGGGGGPHVKVLDGADGGTAPDLVVETDPAAAIGSPTTVLAWARVDGTTPLARGDDVPGEVTGEPMPGALGGGSDDDILVGGTTSYDEPYGQTFNGGVFVGAGDVGSGDDVVVDGRIITGQDPAAAERELFELLGFQDDLDATGEILTLGFTAMDWGAAAPDASGLQDVPGDGSVRFDPF